MDWNELSNWLMEHTAMLLSLPWLLIALFLAPFCGLAYGKKIYPHTAFAIVLALPCLLSLVLLARPDLSMVVIAADLGIAFIALCDLLSLPSKRAFSAERDTIRVVSLKQRHRVSITLNNHSRRRWFVRLRDDVPQAFQAEPEEFARRVLPRSRVTIRYELRSRWRGAFRMEFVYLNVLSRLGFWQRYLTYRVESILHVYPDMKQIGEYALLARTNRLSLMGVRRTRKVGQDNDFERLRDYTLDDNYKHIDWRATARRRKLTVKDYQTSQSQRIVFLLDCGRMMTNEASGLSLLDHSLNAMLMLSFVALQQGDSVGLLCFSDEVHNYVPPRGGNSQMNRLLHASFDRFPRLVESRYDQAFFYLATHCRKRSLVVLMTNVIDEVNAHQVEQYLGTLVGKHLPLGVLMRDRQLFDAAEKPSPQGVDLYTAAAAAQILSWRRQVITDLEHKGVLSVDVFPENMTAPLVNRYLEIKARHLL